MDSAFKLRDELDTLDANYRSKDEYFKKLRKKMEKLEVFKTMDLNEQKNLTGTFEKIERLGTTNTEE